MAMAQVSDAWNGQALERAIYDLFTAFIKPLSILAHIQNHEFLEQKDIEEVRARTTNQGDTAGAELLLKKLCERDARETDWFQKFCDDVLHHHDMKLQHVARMMTTEVNECQSNRIYVRKQSVSSLYIEYNQRMMRAISPTFTHVIIPKFALPVFSKVSNNKVLTKLDEENINALAEKYGNTEGSKLLLERLVLYEDWYEVLLKALKELGLGYQHVIPLIDKATADTRSWYVTKMENHQTYLKSTGHQRDQERNNLVRFNSSTITDVMEVDGGTQSQSTSLGHHLTADGGGANQQNRQEMSYCVGNDDSLENDGAEMKENHQPPAVQSLSHFSSPFSQKGAMQVLTAANTVSDCGFDVPDCGFDASSCATGASDPRLNGHLMRAAKTGDVELLTSLILNKANLNCQDRSGRTPLVICMLYNHVESAMLFIEAGAMVDLADKFGRTALIYAAKRGHSLCLEPLLSCKLAVDKSGKTALIHAATNGRKDCVRQLLDARCDVNKQDKFGNTAIMYAAHKAHFECVELLCSHADVSISNKNGVTALMLAAEKGCDRSVKLILEKKNCNLNARHCDGHTALMYAAIEGHYSCVKLLTESLCDVNMSNKKGLTALMFAAQKGHGRCVQLLIALADLNKRDDDGCTALMIAVLYNRIEIVQMLVDAKAGINIANKDNYTPLRTAKELRHNECVTTLRNAGGV